MKVKAALKRIVQERDLQMISRIVDALRYKNKMTYEETYALFHKHTGISRADFEALMYEADYYY